MNSVTIDNVTKRFGTLCAVNALSSEIPAGTIFGFLGPNGAGKTTLLRMIMNIFSPDSGEIRVLGENSLRCAKDKIGYMPEERGLYRKMSVRDVLYFLGGIRGMNKKALASAVPEWLARVGLQDKVNKKVEELSRGMQQNLQFVATVLNNPEVLILDEPFSGLDPVNMETLKDILLDCRTRGVTIIFSTHIMEKAEQICDRILLINKGRKVIEGTLDGVKAGFRLEKYSLEVEGDGAFITTLPMVQEAVLSDGKWDVALQTAADSRDLLRAVLEKTRILSFNRKDLSLHEIFIKLVGKKDE
ncbi:MAG: ATP-binding cassette domain-containing protein [Candidatus Sumerlaeota bacterium]|nr:ATP-binding cassette domain-containing protein [Candidatus Sumerlaeota bacterium]